MHSSVPLSDVIVREFRALDKFTSTDILSHNELLYMIGGYNAERGVKMTGHRAYFLTDIGVELNRALINYSIDFLLDKGYNLLQTPQLMRRNVMSKTAELADFDETLYKVSSEKNTDDDLYLIATSEQPISAYHMNELLDKEQKYCGISTCYRKEAGSTGKDTWGIFRVHQFEKIEQFMITEPDQSWETLEKLIGTSEEFYKSLGLSFNVVSINSKDMNNTAAKKYDLEAWFPYQKQI